MSKSTLTSVSTDPDPSVGDNAVHEEICGWFLGPRAENADRFRELVLDSIEKHVARRCEYQPEDADLITKEIKDKDPYKNSIMKLKNALELLNGGLSEGTVPFWSGRYNAHMTNDTTMAGLLGYWSTMLSNPNNVAMEASPFTGEVEKCAGLQLANCLGFNIGARKITEIDPLSWGHITCDGSVANLEALWAARNLKFYPLSLRSALEDGCFPPPVPNTFMVPTCQGKTIKFMDLSTWDMLNLQVVTILQIPTRLKNEYNITPDFLTRIMHKYSVQTVGKDIIERKYKIVPPKCTVSSTRHYSWPKAGAVLGIGEANIINIPVDNKARLDVGKLEHELTKLNGSYLQAVYMVVVVAGSTEEGSVDPVEEVIQLREKLQKQFGLSFVIHVDAAWGGYFRTMARRRDIDLAGDSARFYRAPPYTGILTLREDTEKHLIAIAKADSVTIDPHKSGYIPYPAGALCYRDERMKYLVTWDSPYITTQSGVEEIGTFGIEGSKPGAAAVATALSNYVIGMYHDGYGKLLGQALFAASRFSAHWATMEREHFIVVPFNMLPEEPCDKLERYGTSIEVRKQREHIRKDIIPKSDRDLKDDKIAMKLLGEIGSELIINAFACNFFLDSPGAWNEDVEEANYLNTCIALRLRVVPGDVGLINERKLFITSTIFERVQYGECAEAFKKRLGLNGEQDLFVLRNVVMSPFVTSPVALGLPLLEDLMTEFRNVADEEAKVRHKCNAIDFKDTQQFIMQGIEELYLVYQHLFHMAGHREQIIIAVSIPTLEMEKYRAARIASPEKVFFLYSKGTQSITTMLEKEFAATFKVDDHSEPIEVIVTINRQVKRRPINYKFLRNSRPMEYLPFYLYGNQYEQHIDHMLIEAPSTQISADLVNVDCDLGQQTAIKDHIQSGLIAIIFSSDGCFIPPGNEMHRFPIFVPDKDKVVKVYIDPKTEYFDDNTLNDMLKQKPLATGKITCKGNVFLDNESPNQIPVPTPHIQPLQNRYWSKPDKRGVVKDTPGDADRFIRTLRTDMGLPTDRPLIRDMFRFGA